jgi:dTDP-4-amino-4,6-dideoxygalactose transaminase
MEGLVRRPIVPEGRTHNAHMYYLLLPSLAARSAFIDRLTAKEIQPVFHYVPLHSSPFGQAAGRAVGDLPVTCSVSERLVRLPFWIGIEDQLEYVIEEVRSAVLAVTHQRRVG